MNLEESKKCLVIGISNYNNLPELKYCEKDAKDLLRVLDSYNYKISLDNNRLIGNVNSYDLRTQINEFFSFNVGPKDTLILYFSGHSIIDSIGECFLIPSDSDKDLPSFLGYSIEELLKNAKRCISRRIIIILDCCFSGQIILSQKLFFEYYKKIIGDEGDRNTILCILASSQPYNESFIIKDHGKNSLFTNYLIKGLSENIEQSVDKNGNITPDSLYGYIYDKILSIPEDDRNNQIPISHINNNIEKIIASFEELDVGIQNEIIQIPMLQKDNALQLNNVLKEYIKKGEEFFIEGDYIKARDYYGNNINIIYSYAAVSYHNEGLSNLLLKNYREAIQDFDKAIAINSNYASAWNYKAICLIEIGKINDGIECFDNAISINPKDHGLFFNKGIAKIKQNEYTKSIEYFNKAIELNPFFVEALNNKGVSLISILKYDEAIRCFNEILSIKKNDIIALNNLALTYSKKNNFTKSVEILEKLIKNNPNNSSVFFTKGLVLEDKGIENYDDALKMYDKSLEFDPLFVDALYRKGMIFGYLQDHSKAKLFFDEVIKIKSDYIIWFNRSVSCYKIGNNIDALKSIEESLRLKPDYSHAWFAKGVIFQNDKKFEDALNSYNKCIELDNKLSFPWYNKGIIYENLGNANKAIECYEKAIEIDPKDSMSYNNKGLIFYSLQNYDLALMNYNKAIYIDPNNSRAWANKGNIKFQLHKFDEAIECYEKAIEIDPILFNIDYSLDRTHAWSNKGFLLFSSGRYKEALHSLDKAIEIDRNNYHAWYIKGLLFNNRKNYKDALFNFEKAYFLKRKDPEYKTAYVKSLNNRGTDFVFLGNHIEAIEYFDKAIKIEPTYIIPWHNKGSSLMILHRYDEANYCITKARELNNSK